MSTPEIAKVQTPKNRQQLVQHMTIWHGASDYGEDNINDWTLKDIKALHEDDHESTREIARVYPHDH